MSARAIPHTRTGDPVTSYIAGEEAHGSGAAERQAAIILDLVARFPGSTSRELAAAGGIDRYAPARRLPELERAGDVRRGDMRRCADGGRLSATWWPAGNRQGQLL